MNHSLLLIPKTTGSVSLDDLVTFLVGTKKVRMHEGNILYTNPYTGTHFYLNILEESRPIIEFSMPYFKPHFFALEAGLFLENLTKHCAFNITNSQKEESSDDTFNKEVFINNYAVKNQAVAQHIWAQASTEEKQKIFLYPREKQNEIWEWNFQCESKQESSDANVHYPTINPFYYENKMHTFFILPKQKNVPFAIPPADLVLITKEQDDKVYFRSQSEIHNELESNNITNKSIITKEIFSALEPFFENAPSLTPPFKPLEASDVLDSESVAVG